MPFFSRPAPSAGSPRFMPQTMYRYNLRPVVITCAGLSALWSLFSGISFFRAISVEKSNNVSDLVPLSIVLGALYLAITGIELFGVAAAVSRKLAMVRIYALLSALTTLVVVAGGILRIVIHFTKKNELINECATITSNDGVAVYPFGFWGPVSNGDLDINDARDWCTRSWNHDSWSEIVSLLITAFLAGFFTMIVFSYYRQLLDPQSPANAQRAPSNTVRVDFPNHYNRPYDGGYGYNMPYAGGPPPGQFAPPQGPPPGQQYAPPAGPPPGLAGGYSTEKDTKADNPFEDFTETGNTHK